MKRIALPTLGLCLGCLLVAVIARITMEEKSIGVTDPQGVTPRKRQIQYSFTLQNEADHVLQKAEFWTYGPVKETSTQRCDHLEASHPYDLTVDDMGNQVLHFTFKDLPPYASKIVSIRAELSLTDTPGRVAQGDLGGFVKPDRHMESDDPRLVKLVQDIRAEKPGGGAQAIFKWVSEHIRRAGYTKNDRGALHCLTRKEGDCTEQMYLFVALCRASGIPGRGLGGYVCDGDCILKPNDYHNWAEFDQDGAWQIADPHGGVFMEGPSRYIAMRVMGPSAHEDSNPMGPFHRFRFDGGGLMVRMDH